MKRLMLALLLLATGLPVPPPAMARHRGAAQRHHPSKSAEEPRSQTGPFCLILSAWGEARGSPDEAIRGVMHVVMNRTRHPLFPGTPCGVLDQRGQFMDVARGARAHGPGDARALARMRELAPLVYSGRDPDPTGCATHFYNPAGRRRLGFKRAPAWAARLKYTSSSAGFRFYRLPGGECE